MRYIINTLKFLLWDQDNRDYDFKIEVSDDSKSWKTLCDLTKRKSWQEIKINKMSVKHVRIIGTGGNNNYNNIHIVKFMAYFDYSR